MKIVIDLFLRYKSLKISFYRNGALINKNSHFVFFKQKKKKLF